VSEARARSEDPRDGRDRPALARWLAQESPYTAYTYSYPHKTAYRPIDPVPLDLLWRQEPREALFLYFHVPFCESRCGYCNLFSHAALDDALAVAYLEALARQVQQVRAAITPTSFAQIAIGGGTPTQLSRPLLERLFDLAETGLGASLSALPVSLETSPATASPEQLRAASARGIDRISIGVQSFEAVELGALCRRQSAALAAQALDHIRAEPFQTLNIDLIYGIDGQTVESWLRSLRVALRWRPEELYLYPLYVRPLTGLGRRAGGWAEQRLELYRAGRELLLAEGYTQLSMRMFRRDDSASPDGPVYTCQEDGMVGIGCGARSYTRALHYSDEWAVGASGVREILSAWVARPTAAFGQARYGYFLDDADQRARYLVKTLFRCEGLDRSAYREYLARDVVEDFPELEQLVAAGLAEIQDQRIRLTPGGIELSDSLGPWLYSGQVREAMQGFQLR